MARHIAATPRGGTGLTRAEMHAYYIAVVTMPRLIFHLEQLDPQG